MSSVSLDSEGVRAAEVKKMFEILYIDDFVVGTENQFDLLIKSLKNFDYHRSGTFNVVNTGNLII